MDLRLIFLPSYSIHELLHILGEIKFNLFPKPKRCGNERSRLWQCKSCLGIPSQLCIGIIKWAVPVRWWLSESFCKSCQRHARGRAPSPYRPAESHLAQRPGEQAWWHIIWSAHAAVLARIVFSWLHLLACRQPNKLLPCNSISCLTVEMLYCKWAKFIFRELLILTLLA